jgi:hypothetical protein
MLTEDYFAQDENRKQQKFKFKNKKKKNVKNISVFITNQNAYNLCIISSSNFKKKNENNKMCVRIE